MTRLIYKPKLNEGVMVKINNEVITGVVEDIDENGFMLNENLIRMTYVRYDELEDIQVLVYNSELL